MSENFLSRWSRRKRAASIPPPQGEGGEDRRSEPGGGHSPPTVAPVEKIEAPTTPYSSPPVVARTGGGEPQGSAPQATTFDATTLPPIESIDAGTDISAFLRPGVPADLAQAALRRAWVADPAIRDFVGLAENAWDFNAPDGVPGFGPLRAIDDVQRLAAQIAGVMPAARLEDAAAEQPSDIATADTVTEPTPASVPSEEAAPKPADDVAAQNGSASERDPSLTHPRHGGA